MQLTSILENGTREQITDALKERFVGNLQFFSSYSEPLARRLQEKATQYNIWLDEKGVNILDITENRLLFPEIEGMHGWLKSAQYVASEPFSHPSWKFYSNDISPSDMDEAQFPHTGKMHNRLLQAFYAEIAEHYPQWQEQPNRLNIPHGFLPSVTMFGLLGGLHLECLRERYARIHSLLIFEESLDLFRISCHVVDYPALFSQVSKNACYLFIENLMDRKFVKHFFEARRISANFLRLELTLYDSPKNENVRTIIEESHRVNARGWGTFEDEMIGINNALENINYLAPAQKHPILLKPKRINAPVCVVGNGPSLNALLPFIKENASRMIILSAGTALKPLLSAGITPDFQVEIERIDYLHEVLQAAPLGSIPLVGASVLNPKALGLSVESYLFQRGESSVSNLHAPKFILQFAAPFVGNAAFALAALFGSDVLIAGLDCGYIKGESKHAQNSFYGEESEAIPEGCFRVQGNSTQEVYSDSIFSLSRENIEYAISYFKPKSVLNLGRGAYINGARATRVEEFELRKINKARALAEFKSAFSRQSAKLFGAERDFHMNEWKVMESELLGCFSQEIRTKEELFRFVDELFALCGNLTCHSPYLGILLGGSLSHYLQALLIDAFHLPGNDISTLFERARDIFRDGFLEYYREYASAIVRHRLKNGTGIA